VTNALAPLINATLQAVPSAALPANFSSLLASSPASFCALGSSRRALAGYWLGSGVMPALQLALPAPPAGRSATPPLCFSG
jgi:hypothetical protein